jgi:RND family efflux transporter MFP subunit
MNTTLIKVVRPGNLLRTLLLTSLLTIAACEEAPPPAPPKPVKALQISAPGGLAEGSFPGLAAAEREANLSSRIDPNDFQVALDNAKSVLGAAQAAARRAEADYGRLLNVQQEDPGATSQRAVDLALALRDESRAAVSSASATVQTATDRLGYTSLLAPFNGDVVETYVENFETVVAQRPILRLVDKSVIEMTLSIPENLIGYADFVTSISVTFDALPGVKVDATISEIGREASQATRTYPLTIVMRPPADAGILPGMAGQAAIQAQLPEAVSEGVHVPPTALFAGTDTERSYVWIIENDVVTRREVQTGELTSTGILVTAGLNPGELIVATGVSALAEGQGVRVIDVGEAQ